MFVRWVASAAVLYRWWDASVVESTEKRDSLLDPNALISLRRNLDVRHEIRRVTRRR